MTTSHDVEMKCPGYTDWHIKNCKAIRIDFYFYVDFMLSESAINSPFRNCFLYWVTVFVLAHVVKST